MKKYEIVVVVIVRVGELRLLDMFKWRDVSQLFVSFDSHLHGKKFRPFSTTSI